MGLQRVLLAGAGAVAVGMLAGAARAGSFVYTSFDIVGGQLASDATDINDAGQVWGSYADASNNQFAFVYAGGTTTSIAVLPSNSSGVYTGRINANGLATGAVYDGMVKPQRYQPFTYDTNSSAATIYSIKTTYGSFPLGINNAGSIVGWTVGKAANAPFKGFDIVGGAIGKVTVKGSKSTNPTGINDAGQICGAYVDAGGVQHGFLLTGKKLTTIDPAGSTDTWASFVNNAGEVGGYYSDSQNSTHGFTLNGGVIATANYPGAVQTVLNRSASNGILAGYYEDGAGATHGMLYQGGHFTSVDYPGAVFTNLLAVNAGGSAVGLYRDAAGVYHGFLASCPAGQFPCS
jgi:hypothetical protein